MMRVWCVGGGEVGGVIAARLARAGIDLTVLDTDPEYVRRLRDPGLEVAGIGGGVAKPMAAYTPSETSALGQPPELVLLSGRTDGAERMLHLLLPFLGDVADVVCLQGAAPDAVAAVVGANRTITATVGFRSTWLGPGRVSLDSTGDIAIGRLDGSLDAGLESVRQVLGYAFATTITQSTQGASGSVQEPSSPAPEAAPESIARPESPVVPMPSLERVIPSAAPSMEAPPIAPRVSAAKSRRGRARLVIPLVLVVALGFLLVRWIGGPDAPAGPPGADPGSGPDRSAAPEATPGVVGKSIQTLDGNTLTVYSVESPAKPNRELIIAAEEGTRLAAVNVEFCVREDFGASGTVSESQFRVEVANDRRVGFWDTPDYAKDPRFATQTVKPGDCSRGWITFQVPENQEITHVHWTPAKDSPQALSWDVSGD